MFKEKRGLAIVNRNFWPKSQVLGEALLRLAERAAEINGACVITQSDESLKESFSNAGRGQGVEAFDCKARTTSASGIIKRALESLVFMGWTFISLIRFRPAKVYVATDPPVVVPFVVFLYSKLFRCEYYYHLQDIHPEAANIVVPVNGFVYKVLRAVDNLTIRHSTGVITLSEDMKSFIVLRSGMEAPIYLLDNPSFEVAGNNVENRLDDVVFCGNAGRLQRIPLLLGAIEEYIKSGGKLRFTFIGRGVYAGAIKELAGRVENVRYLGYLPAPSASEVVSQHQWALLPIDDEVTKYAFPSKSSSYVQSGCGLVTICGSGTSVARWVSENSLGLILEPSHQAVVEGLFRLEAESAVSYQGSKDLLSRLEIDSFVEKLSLILFSALDQN